LSVVQEIAPRTVADTIKPTAELGGIRP